MYRSIKVFPSAFSAAFRQHRAESHCHFVHGYALSVELTFEADELDKRNWVVDFGELKDLRGTIAALFDHKTIVAEDDPALKRFQEAHKRGDVDLIVMPHVGCEAFAQEIHEMTEAWLDVHGYLPRVRIAKVGVWEHDGNGAEYEP